MDSADCLLSSADICLLLTSNLTRFFLTSKSALLDQSAVRWGNCDCGITYFKQQPQEHSVMIIKVFGYLSSMKQGKARTPCFVVQICKHLCICIEGTHASVSISESVYLPMTATHFPKYLTNPLSVYWYVLI